MEEEVPVIRPLNFPPAAPGRGYIIKNGVMVVNLIGRVFVGQYDCPFRAMDSLLSAVNPLPKLIVVDFHAEATSEKVALGRYLDGAKSAWERIERATGAAVTVSENLFAHFSCDVREVPRAFALPEDDLTVRRYEWEHRIMRVELDFTGHIRPQAAYNWLEESVFEASAEAGWPPERRMASGFLILQMRHDTQFFALPEFGERIRIISRLVDTRRFRGTWIQEILSLNQNRVLARDYSTGIFVDIAGRPVTPPPEMMADMQGKTVK
ncbi:metallophosphoesterase [Candidatus Moduliflexus flocculans]|uniref:Metallophosphoesterase n=1 Tax=Candidatus Moduliflexus flocculans TaxID=1499966 RepID=A0A0S6W052_9BACT|nr:metallophosphoesterase [Candidatus Moduliflexus flocculans]